MKRQTCNKETHDMKLNHTLVFVSIFLLTLVFFVISDELFPTVEGKVARFYLENSIHSIKSVNTVNAVIWEFRGYDTLGEELVIITASLSVFLLLYKERR